MKQLEPFSLDELEQVTAIAHGQARRAWTVTLDGRRRLLIWALNGNQAAAIARARGHIQAISQNYHAQNMRPRPESWSDFIAQGGEA